MNADFKFTGSLASVVSEREDGALVKSISLYAKELKDGWEVETVKISGNSLMIQIVKEKGGEK